MAPEVCKDSPTQSSQPDSSTASEDEDEQLQRAIALSLVDQEQNAVSSSTSHAPPSPKNPTAVTHEKRLEAIRSPPVLSSTSLLPSMSNSQSCSANTNATITNTNGNGLAGLNRAQMEAERLARLKLKRKRESDVGASSRREISPPPMPSSRRTDAPSHSQSSIKPIPIVPSKSSTTPPLLAYPNGIVKQTPISSASSTLSSRSITLSSILDANQLESVLLSSFTWDFDWLFPHFRTNETKFLLVMHAHDAKHRDLLKSDFEGIRNIRLIFPPTTGTSQTACMHSKLMLLFYATHLRIVVPTANLMSFDWGEGPLTGVMENTVWLMDLPLLPPKLSPEGQPKTPNEGNESGTDSINSRYPFYLSLLSFLHAQSVPDTVLHKLSRFDFSATARNRIGFVHTIAGSHTDESLWRGTGHCGLGRTVQELGLQPRESEELDIDFVTSSVGSLTEEFLRGIYLAAAGDDGMMELGIRKGGKPATKVGKGIDKFFKAKHQQRESADDKEGTKKDVEARASGIPPSSLGPSPATTTPVLNPDGWRRNFRFFFPSHRTVARSTGGPHCAGTICFQRRWWENATKFPRVNMRDCVSVRRGLLMHNKIMFVRYKKQLDAVEEDLTEKLKKQRSERTTTMTTKKKKKNKRRDLAGWAYVGSANLSESAWGRLVVDRTRKPAAGGEEKEEEKERRMMVKLNCRNWECGIVLPVPLLDEVGEDAVKSGLEVFESVVPVPMEYPGRSYEDGSDIEPWFFGKDGMAT